MSLTKKLFLLGLVIFASIFIFVESTKPTPNGPRPDWEAIKNGAHVVVYPEEEYETPYGQPLSTLAWEDGVYMSRDGLHLYAFYAPFDMFRFIDHFIDNPNCPDITPFIRGPVLTMDFSTNPWGCKNMMHSDVAYSSRSNTSESFTEWGVSNIANPAVYDGAFAALDNTDGTIDAVYSHSTEANKNDLFWAKHVTHNPPLSAFSPLPSPVNTSEQEDNPHLEHLNSKTLVLLFDNDGAGDNVVKIKYSLSTNDGITWSEPKYLSEPINKDSHDNQGHLYFDGTAWWLYFTSDRDGLLSIFRSKHNDSKHIVTDFDDWNDPEKVIGPGTIENDSGFVAGVGEPTLTAQGDISFVVAYCDIEDKNSYDHCDIDPWFLTKR